jgi:dCTP diphosphatase
MLSDDTIQAVLAFRQNRDWKQFHSPKNLAIGIAVEAGELLELFQWTTNNDGPRRSGDALPAVGDEIADVAILLIYLLHDLGIDLDGCIRAKLAVNDRRYPIEKSHGNAAKYDEY